ncbi:MAG: shikimate dehydrogenase [Chitinophagales bacterium]|jgi:shikimate dehydrogenase|nr:shikimate dehydrogenase [Bacteroidota bacterium]MBP8248708.1 shikimate dehydrogenase [Chitinophagales bacterium]MBK9504526.1 shikimate dehydrogenase [Bacteroidota bacterium]MBK9557295.1 shikimate dehydrogenase [Bacteroidota bacterium]MBL0280459.1 shikimate dehydrogenase [Bacteroidota bacterium]
MKLFGLIGFPLSHSFSEKFFSEKFEREDIEDCKYELYPLENIEDIRLLFEVNKDLKGLNVTIPYKESVIEYLDDLDDIAQKIGAINCIKIDEIQRVGYNTDYAGFRDSLKPLLKKHHTQALVLGTGGASKAVVYALQELGISTTLVSRKTGAAQLTYADINKEIIDNHTIIINCSPVGMYPDINQCPDIPYQFINSAHILYDLVYNPGKTMFLQHGEKQGATIKNGLEMLELQAEYAWEIWNQVEDEEAASGY